jgi:hypothetical protein
MNEDESQARSLGLGLLDASRIYEDFSIPRYEGRLRRRAVLDHRRLSIGLIGRQRRFLRAVYTLTDAGLGLEAIGPLRSMFEFLVCQRWLALDPDRNWKLWVADDHAKRDVWRERLQRNTPALHDAAAASRTPAQREEEEVIVAVRKRLSAELGDRWRDEVPKIERQAELVGLSTIYDGLYRYESSAALHATLLAIDLITERRPGGLLLRREPTAQFASLSPYLHGALLLYEALKDGAELAGALDVKELPSLGRDIYVLAERYASTRMPNWRELLPAEAFSHT